MESVRLPLPDDTRARWRELERESEQPSIFRTPEWIEAWAEATGSVEKTVVHVWKDGHEIVAVLPITATRERLHPRLPLTVPVGIITGAGTGAADHTGWTATAKGTESVLTWLRTSRGALLLRSLDSSLAKHIDETGVHADRERCPRLDLAEDGNRSKSFSKRLEYYRRRAAREGCVLTVTKPGEVDSDQLVTLGRLHTERFDAASVLSSRAFAIHEAFRRRQRPDIGPVVVTAAIEGKPIGMLWGLWFAGVFAYYQSGWLPQYRALNLGTVLVDHAISTAHELGATTFDFLRGPEDYKYKFGAVDRTDVSMLIPRGASGTLLQLKARMRATIR